jgi:hypothetical protein
MTNDIGEILYLLGLIASGDDWSVSIARDLESAVLAQFPDADDDERFENLMLMLALYEPAGGDCYVDRHRLADECAHVLKRLSG